LQLLLQHSNENEQPPPVGEHFEPPDEEPPDEVPPDEEPPDEEPPDEEPEDEPPDDEPPEEPEDEVFEHGVAAAIGWMPSAPSGGPEGGPDGGPEVPPDELPPPPELAPSLGGCVDPLDVPHVDPEPVEPPPSDEHPSAVAAETTITIAPRTLINVVSFMPPRRSASASVARRRDDFFQLIREGTSLRVDRRLYSRSPSHRAGRSADSASRGAGCT